MKKLSFFLFAVLVATSWSGINNPTGGNGTVTAVSVSSANGISGSSSGGATPALTLALGAITPTSISITGTTNPLVLTYGGATSPAAYDTLVSKTNETGVPRPGQSSQVLGSFEMTQTYAAASNGAGRRDNIWQWGYNIPGSPNYVANDDTFDLTIENSYTPGLGLRQGEFYFSVRSGDGVMNTRPFTITPSYDLHTCDIQTNADNVYVADLSGSNWAGFQSVSSGGTLALSGASKIAYSGSNTQFLTASGNDILGFSSGIVYVGSGVTSASFFAGTNLTDGLSLTVGKLDTAAHNRGLRWNATNGWQFQVADSGWQNMGQPISYWVTGTLAAPGRVGIGPTSFTPGDLTSTFEVYDATASTGITRQVIRAGAGQSGTLFEIVANNGSTDIFKVDGSTAWTSYLRDLGNTFALQTGFDSTNVLLFGSGKTIGWTSTANFYDAVNVTWGRTATATVGSNGDIATTTAGKTLHVKSGSNAKAGTFTLSSGTATVSNTSVTANSVVCCTVKTSSGTLGTGTPEIVITASTGFTATGVATDNSTYNFVIFEVD